FQIGPEPAEAGRHRSVEIGVVARLPEAGLGLLSAADALSWPQRPTSWAQEVAALRAATLYDPPPANADGPLHPLHVFDALAEAIEARGEDSVCVTVDGGEFGQWA